MNRFDSSISLTASKLTTRKKIIFVTFCLILFLIFTALSYGELDPKYKKFREDPWQHFKSPTIDDNQNLDFVLLAINCDFYLVLTFESKAENFRDLDELTKQKPDSFTKHDSLNKNETKSKN